MQKTETSVICLLLLFILEVEGLCPPETECFGHGEYNSATQTCPKCDSLLRTGQYTGECCESISCKQGTTCKHGYCGSNGVTCKKCQTGWGGPNCENVTLCFSWCSCDHGSCTKSRFKCECDSGWVGDLCDRSVCQVPCKFGSCPRDPKECECHENYFGEECERSICADGWECQNGGYCVDPRHCVCPPHYSGKKCEIVSECIVPCEHGRCTHKPDVCECEANWGPPGNCSIYEGPCSNCSSVGGTCKKGPHTCECKPGKTCEIVSECIVPCEHGRCTHKPDVCECEANWGPPGNCSIYEGPCSNCSSVGGTCKKGPHTCECKSGYMGPQCSELKCEGCAHGRCEITNDVKTCTCDYAWSNKRNVAGFDPSYGPCQIVSYCAIPCTKGTCPTDPYECKCTSPYTGTHCDVIQCPKCCPPQTCDCSDPIHIKCRTRWHHDCCLVKSCFRGDTLVHTAKGLVPIESVKEGDMVVTRHEGENPSMTNLSRVDQVRKRFVPMMDLVVFRMHDEDIWVTPDHLFFEVGTGSWMSAGNVTTSHSFQGLKGKMVKLQQQLKASQLLKSSSEANLVPVYDLSVREYDRYAVGKDGLLVSACNDSVDLAARDKQVWDEAKYPRIAGVLNPPQIYITVKDDDTSNLSSVAIVVSGVALGVACLVTVLLVLFLRLSCSARGAE